MTIRVAKSRVRPCDHKDEQAKTIHPHDGIVRPAIRYDESGGNPPSEIDGTPSNGPGWTPRMARSSRLPSIWSAGVHITETRTKPRLQSRPKTQIAGRCEGAAGSLANLAPGRSPHPRSTIHGSRLPAISCDELRSGIYPPSSDPGKRPGPKMKGDVIVDRPTCPGGTGAPIKSAPD